MLSIRLYVAKSELVIIPSACRAARDSPRSVQSESSLCQPAVYVSLSTACTSTSHARTGPTKDLNHQQIQTETPLPSPRVSPQSPALMQHDSMHSHKHRETVGRQRSPHSGHPSRSTSAHEHPIRVEVESLGKRLHSSFGFG